MNGERIEELVGRVQSLPDLAARNAALELVQAVMDFHATGLRRMIELVFETDPSGRVEDALAADDSVSGILLLHDLHPLDLGARVRRALDQPAFHGRVELMSLEGGVVRVRVLSGPGLRPAIEKVLGNAAPDAAAIALEGGEVQAADFVPLEQLLAS